MKNKVMVLVIAGILTVGGISVAYATGKNNDDKSSYNYSSSMMGTENDRIQSNDSYNDMIKAMNDNGFSDEAKAMENRDFDSMNDIMNNISDDDYKEMIDIMEENGYGSMSNMMGTIGREDTTEFHEGMMGR
jgi:tRNA A37 N6-isopentenylltransferase MiaA